MNFTLNNRLASVTQILANRCVPYYELNGGRRFYHNIEHMQNVVNSVFKIVSTPSDALLLAAIWHDAIYMPGAGVDANERCSAAALKSEYLSLNASGVYGPEEDQIVEAAMDLIMHTSIDVHLTDKELDGELAILLDADLSSLADPYDQFIETQKKIVKENGADWNDPATRLKDAEFLAKFLECRFHIYHTDYARQNWEKEALNNIVTLSMKQGVPLP